jgi:hypothetical protein
LKRQQLYFVAAADFVPVISHEQQPNLANTLQLKNQLVVHVSCYQSTLYCYGFAKQTT